MADLPTEESGDYTRFGILDAPKKTVKTPFGKRKSLAGLSKNEIIFWLLSSLNILVTVALTIYSLVHVVKTESSKDPDVTFAIVVLVNAVFVAFYVIHGVLRERKYELYVQIIAVLILAVYCIVEYVTNGNKRTTVKLVRLISVCLSVIPTAFLSILVTRGFGVLQFKIAGAFGYPQGIYNTAAFFSCLLKFDLQVTISLVIVVLRNVTDIDTMEIVTLAVGITFTLLWCIAGWFILRLESKSGSKVFVLFGLAKPVYYGFKIVRVYQGFDASQSDIKTNLIKYIVLICAALAGLVWLILMLELCQVVGNFGKGLKDRGTLFS